jgi:ion channel POLLUX/CASTOR
MKRFSISQKIKYKFDEYMARGTGALIIGLAIITAIVILIAGVVLIAFGINQAGADSPLGIGEALWSGFMHTMDAGALGADSGWGFRIVMLIVTLGGIFILSTLIGVLSAGLEAKLEALRRGRSTVIESGHTAILGWNGQIFPIIEELILANENQRKSCIVVLADRDKPEMEEELAERIPARKRTKIVMRSGSASRPDDLGMANLAHAKSIIILSGEGQDPDAEVIKTALAVMKDRAKNGGNAPIIAEVNRPENIDPARIAAEGQICIVKVGELVSRIIAQSSRQLGLSSVYLELLDFEGDEMYFCADSSLYGKTYREIIFSFDDCTVMGIMGRDGKAELNPAQERRLENGEKVIVIAADDEVAKPVAAPLGGAKKNLIVESLGVADEKKPEHTLILCWNWKVPMIIAELDGYVAPGSSVSVACESETALDELQGLKETIGKQDIRLLKGNTADRKFLEGLRLANFDRIVVMSDQDADSVEAADAKSIVTLLHLREIAKRDRIELSIVSEILDIRNRELAEAAKANDFIVSDRLLSLMLAMLSENPALESVFEDLFDSGGSELYLKPVGLFVKCGAKLDFLTVAEAASRRGETAIGFSIAALSKDPDSGYGIRVNPPKGMEIEFQPEDRIIVLAED